VNVNLENKSSTQTTSLSNTLKFLTFGGLGVLIFFVPFTTNSGSKIPLVIIIDLIKGVLGGALQYIILGLMLLLCLTWIIAKVTQNLKLNKYHEKDSYIIGFLFILAGIFTPMLTFGWGPEWFLHKDVGGLALSLGGSVFLTVSIAGIFVLLLTEFGVLEFIGTLMEPLMRPVYKLPGRAAVDAVASFVAAPAVGVFITNKIYTNGYYTQKEAASITTNFSVCSIGFFALLATIGGIIEYFPHMVITSFVVTFILAAIMVRIPPLSRKQNIYFDGREQTQADLDIAFQVNIFQRAFNAATEKAATTDAKCLKKGIWDAVTFAQKIVAYVISISVIALVLATYTPLFTWLGIPIVPILKLFAIPNAVEIAPAVLVSIAEIALPVIIISGLDVATMSIFFICTLSTVQIIFFTESANAMLESDIPIGFWDLIIIFLIRTLLAMPLIALATHIIF